MSFSEAATASDFPVTQDSMRTQDTMRSQDPMSVQDSSRARWLPRIKTPQS